MESPQALVTTRLAHTTAMVEAWPGAKSLSVFFDVNEAPPAGSGGWWVVGLEHIGHLYPWDMPRNACSSGLATTYYIPSKLILQG